MNSLTVILTRSYNSKIVTLGNVDNLLVSTVNCSSNKHYDEYRPMKIEYTKQQFTKLCLFRLSQAFGSKEVKR